MSVATRTKTPGAILDYTFNWEPWLRGDTLASSTWSYACVAQSGELIDPVEGDLVIDNPAHPATFGALTSTVWVCGGAIGNKYAITNRVTTAQGREDDRTVDIIIVSK
jgi:hypothetical protein